MLRVVNLTIFLVSLLLPTISVGRVLAETLPTNPFFTEIKVRTDTTNLLDYDEFIEIYNPSDQPIDLANYNLEYFNATNPSLTQQPVQRPLFNYLLGPNSQLTLAKQPIQIANSKQSPFASLSDSGGRLRLVTSEGEVVDEVAWTNVLANATAIGTYPSIVYQCNSSTILCNSNRVQSVSRSQNIDGTFVTTNASWQLAIPTPISSELIAYPAPVTDDSGEDPPLPDSNPTEEQTPQKAITCEGIVISELLPNPSGADTGNEFIELYNPTIEAIGLSGCSLQTSSSTKKYPLPNIILQSGSYVSFTDSTTGVVLPNSAGGTAWLLSPTDEISSVTYPGGVAEDASWALIDNVWEITFSPSPSTKNIPMPVKPCEAGQTRNPETNRCQAALVVAVATLAPCKIGQERNPDTGRCRSLVSSTTFLTACKQGQERNPDTNRCRNIPSNNSLTECDEGQERNPDTNRCRKIATESGSTLAAVTDVPSATTNHPKWWLAVIAIVLALGYAVYEWRRDMKYHITNLISRLKN